MVKTDEGRGYAEQNGLSFAEMTAKEEGVVNGVFDQFIGEVYEQGRKKNIWAQNRRRDAGSETSISSKGKKDKDKGKEERKFNLVKRIKALDKERCCV